MPLESQCCFGADVEAVVQRQYHRKGLSRFDGADNEMNITAWVGQYDSGSAAALCVHVGEAQVELFEPAGHPKHGRCGFKQQHTGDELGTPKDRGLMSGAVGIDQESEIPIAGRCSFVAMHRLAGLLGCYAGCRTHCDSRDWGAATPTRSPAAPAGSGSVRFAAIATQYRKSVV